MSLDFPPLSRKVSQGGSHPIQQIVNLSRDDSKVAQIWAGVPGNLGEPWATSNRSTPLMDSDNPETFSAFSRTPLEFAISPHAKRRVHAEAMGIETRQDSWARMAIRARDKLQGPNWRRADFIDNVSVADSRASRRIGKFRYPLYAHPMMPQDLPDI